MRVSPPETSRAVRESHWKILRTPTAQTCAVPSNVRFSVDRTLLSTDQNFIKNPELNSVPGFLSIGLVGKVLTFLNHHTMRLGAMAYRLRAALPTYGRSVRSTLRSPVSRTPREPDVGRTICYHGRDYLLPL